MKYTEIGWILVIGIITIALIAAIGETLHRSKQPTQLDIIQANQTEILQQQAEILKELKQIYILFKPAEPETIESNSLKTPDGIWRSPAEKEK